METRYTTSFSWHQFIYDVYWGHGPHHFSSLGLVSVEVFWNFLLFAAWPLVLILFKCEQRNGFWSNLLWGILILTSDGCSAILNNVQKGRPIESWQALWPWLEVSSNIWMIQYKFKLISIHPLTKKNKEKKCELIKLKKNYNKGTEGWTETPVDRKTVTVCSLTCMYFAYTSYK